MEEIYRSGTGRVYVGDDRDYERTKDRDDFSWIRCCKYGPGGHQQTLGYHTLAAPEGREHFVVKRGNLMALNMLDLDDPHYVDREMIQQGLDFAKEELLSGRKLLIACNQGESRGPTMGLMFLRSIGDMPHAYLLSQRIYHTIYEPYNPAQGIEQFARMHWASLGETGRV